MHELYKTAKRLALCIIDSEGTDPEWLSIAELSSEVAEDEGLDSEELEAEVDRLIKGAVVTITVPGPVEA